MAVLSSIDEFERRGEIKLGIRVRVIGGIGGFWRGERGEIGEIEGGKKRSDGGIWNFGIVVGGIKDGLI